MVLTPPLSGLVPAIYRRLRSHRPAAEPHEAMNLPTGGLGDHVIIAGAGRVGRGIADALAQLNLPFVLVELDDRRVQQAKRNELPVIYGDASQPIVLEAAGVQRARAMLVTVPSFADVRNIVAAGRQLRTDLPVIARADGRDAVRALYALGIQEVASPEFEAAIEMTRQALMYLNVPAQAVLQVASAIRKAQYGQSGDGQQSGIAMISHLGEVTRHLDFVWVGVPADSPVARHTLGELRIRSSTGAMVVGIIRDGDLVTNPDGDARLEAGDLLAVLGARDQIARFRDRVRPPQPRPAS
jgi:CPA2 family monovalent cation:H+ antiporter-2